jgi:uncharacterized protein
MNKYFSPRAGVRWLRHQYIKLVRLNDTPEKIASGLALGVVIGIFPTFGLGIIMAVFLAGPLKVNRASAILGTLVMNPWTAPFFWAMSYLVGSVVVGNNLLESIEILRDIGKHKDIMGQIVGKNLLLPYIIGNVIVTISAAAISYLVGNLAVRYYRKSKRKRLQKRASNR